MLEPDLVERVLVRAFLRPRFTARWWTKIRWRRSPRRGGGLRRKLGAGMVAVAGVGWEGWKARRGRSVMLVGESGSGKRARFSGIRLYFSSNDKALRVTGRAVAEDI